ncbi:MAG: thiamine pyrophosphate-dependent dehydrogenase E1 component subunit alpha [Clostridiaceae bacterium]|nr:thiamine pyrophosphate-dependent dehydrogenase E1 component subunit alpha [Clostridiaceae bacterium]
MSKIKFVDANGEISFKELDIQIVQNFKLQKELLYKMKLARAFEEKTNELYATGFIHGTLHLAIGQEAAAIGSTAAMTPEDKILITHRGHIEAIGKGMSITSMFSELLGKDSGASKGYGGSMHMIDPDKGILHANGIVGANAPLACGIALALKKQKKDAIATCYLGDGAMNEGAYSESLNLASLWQLPVVFATVNNQYGMSTPIHKSHANTDLTQRGIAFNLPTIEADGNHVLTVYCAMKLARAFALKNQPVILILNTYRISGHSRSDKNRYRKDSEILAWKKRCPIKTLENSLLEQKQINQKDLEKTDFKIKNKINSAIQTAQLSELAKEIQW